MTTQKLVCDLQRVTYDGTPQTMPRQGVPVLVWLPYQVAVGWRSGDRWVWDGGCLELEPGMEWASLLPVRSAAWRSERSMTWGEVALALARDLIEQHKQNG